MAEQAWFPSNSTGADGTGSGLSEAFPQSGAGALPNTIPGAPPPPPPLAPANPRYELRPLTTGELLDRTFHLYRSNFWLFVGLASTAAAVNTATALGKVIYLRFAFHGNITFQNSSAAGAAGGWVFQLITVIAAIFSLAIYGVTQAATTSAVTSIYLGDSTSIKQAFAAIKGRWFRFVLIALWQIWSAAWIFVAIFVPIVALFAWKAAAIRGAVWLSVLVFFSFIPAMVYGMIAYIRNSFAVPAAVMEGLKVRKAVRRSKTLTSGTKGRIFLLFLFIFVLYMVAGAIQAPVAVLILQKKTGEQFFLQAINLFVGFFASAVIGPVGAVGLCLFYIDQRIRREGFDIEFLIERSGPVPEFPTPSLATPAFASESFTTESPAPIEVTLTEPQSHESPAHEATAPEQP